MAVTATHLFRVAAVAPAPPDGGIVVTATALVLAGILSTSAVNRYPCFGTVSIQAVPPSPSALRSTETWNERLASSTKVVGHSAAINSCFEKARPGLPAISERSSNALGGRGTT